MLRRFGRLWWGLIVFRSVDICGLGNVVLDVGRWLCRGALVVSFEIVGVVRAFLLEVFWCPSDESYISG